MLRTLLCPAACGPSHKFERNFETCAMGTQHSSGVVAAFPHRVNLKIQGEVPLVALLFCIKPLYIYMCVCSHACLYQFHHFQSDTTCLIRFGGYLQ